MVHLCENIVREIVAAGTEDELLSVIQDSLTRFKATKSAHRESGYLMNMIVSLQVVRTEPLSEKASKNVNMAIEIFRDIQKKNHGLLF